LIAIQRERHFEANLGLFEKDALGVSRHSNVRRKHIFAIGKRTQRVAQLLRSVSEVPERHFYFQALLIIVACGNHRLDHPFTVPLTALAINYVHIAATHKS